MASKLVKGFYICGAVFLFSLVMLVVLMNMDLVQKNITEIPALWVAIPVISGALVVAGSILMCVLELVKKKQEEGIQAIGTFFIGMAALFAALIALDKFVLKNDMSMVEYVTTTVSIEIIAYMVGFIMREKASRQEDGEKKKA